MATDKISSTCVHWGLCKTTAKTPRTKTPIEKLINHILINNFTLPWSFSIGVRTILSSTWKDSTHLSSRTFENSSRGLRSPWNAELCCFNLVYNTRALQFYTRKAFWSLTFPVVWPRGFKFFLLTKYLNVTVYFFIWKIVSSLEHVGLSSNTAWLLGHLYTASTSSAVTKTSGEYEK